jgi:hypothetical protein
MAEKQAKFWYEKYRWFITSTGAIVIGGKSAEQNEEVIRNQMEKSEIVMHTSEPGSPFSVIKADEKEITAKDLEETAIFTACFSRAWRENKKSAKIDIFKASQISKDKKDKTGTFRVSGKVHSKAVQLKLGLIIQQNKLRAVPVSVGKPFIIIEPGNIEKSKFAEMLSIKLSVSGIHAKKDEILNALPTGKFKISN